jgi:uncharacterized protein YdaU (DUF1376 family)
MTRFSPIRVNYVAFYFRDWIVATSIMSTIERGIYSSLCFHIYEAGGRLENKTSLLASLSGLSELEFLPHWATLKRKFVQQGDFITHKRCLIELRKTDALTKAARKGGLMSAKMRKNGAIIPPIGEQGGSKGLVTPLQLLNETNTKQNNNKTNTNGNLAKTLETIQSNLNQNSDSFLNNSSPSG